MPSLTLSMRKPDQRCRRWGLDAIADIVGCMDLSIGNFSDAIDDIYPGDNETWHRGSDAKAAALCLAASDAQT
jgi:hypothetical protein